MNILKSRLIGICLWVLLRSGWLGSVFAINFKADFAAPLVANEEETVYKFKGLNPDKPILEILTEIFYPPVYAGTTWWKLRDFIRNVWVGIMIVLIIWAGANFVMYPDKDDDIKWNLRNILFLIVWAFIFFWASWILGTVIDFWSLEWVTSRENAQSLLDQAEHGLILQTIVFMKALAFFVAIVFMVWYGFKMMSAMDDEAQRSAARQWLLNVMIALVAIKIIDYLYFIATTGDSFTDGVTELILSVSQFLAYLFGIILFLAIIYAGYLFLTSAGNDDNIADAKKILKTIVIVMLVIFLFLLIIYQIFADLA